MTAIGSPQGFWHCLYRRSGADTAREALETLQGSARTPFLVMAIVVGAGFQLFLWALRDPVSMSWPAWSALGALALIFLVAAALVGRRLVPVLGGERVHEGLLTAVSEGEQGFFGIVVDGLAVAVPQAVLHNLRAGERVRLLLAPDGQRARAVYVDDARAVARSGMPPSPHGVESRFLAGSGWRNVYERGVGSVVLELCFVAIGAGLCWFGYTTLTGDHHLRPHSWIKLGLVLVTGVYLFAGTIASWLSSARFLEGRIEGVVPAKLFAFLLLDNRRLRIPRSLMQTLASGMPVRVSFKPFIGSVLRLDVKAD